MRSGHAVALLPEMAETSLRESGVRRLEFAPMRTYRREIGIACIRDLFPFGRKPKLFWQDLSRLKREDGSKVMLRRNGSPSTRSSAIWNY